MDSDRRCAAAGFGGTSSLDAVLLSWADPSGDDGSTLSISSNGEVADDRGVCKSPAVFVGGGVPGESLSLVRELVIVCRFGLRAALGDLEAGSVVFNW